MPVPSPPLNSDGPQEQDVLLKWREFRSKMSTAVADFNATSGERVWAVNEEKEIEGAFVIRAIVDELDFVNVTLNRTTRKIVCRFGAHVTRPAIEFEMGRAEESLFWGTTQISMAAALDMILMPLLPSDFTT